MVDDGARLQAVERRPRVVDADLELRDADLLLDLQVGETGDRRQLRAQGLGRAAQRVEVVAEDLERNLRPHARQHVIEPVGDRLADVGRQRQHGQALPHVGDDLVLRPAAGLHVDLDIGGVDALGMLVELGPPGAPRHLPHLRHAQQQPFGD